MSSGFFGVQRGSGQPFHELGLGIRRVERGKPPYLGGYTVRGDPPPYVGGYKFHGTDARLVLHVEATHEQCRER